MIIKAEDLQDEEEIVWLINPSELDYVRQFLNCFASRRDSKPKKGDHPGHGLVGYAILKPEARSKRGVFKRRYFWLNSNDRYYKPQGVYKTGCPSEAIDPRTIRAGETGEQTARALGETEQ
jgi:hypothetical protein